MSTVFPSLLPDKDVINPGFKDKWDPVMVDAALDEYFKGAHPSSLGIKYKQSRQAFKKSILNKLLYNYKKGGKGKGKAEKYHPVGRCNRQGQRWTPNEDQFIRIHENLGLDPVVTGWILCRTVDSILTRRFELKEEEKLARARMRRR